MTHDQTHGGYGPWQTRTPHEAADLLRDYAGPWWIAGGWAIEAFTGVHRSHGDVDLSVPRADAVPLREHLVGRLEVWSADRGTVRPLSDTGDVPDTCENLWLRSRDAGPWQYE